MAEFLTTLQNLGFPEILLWLLSFAIVYGVLHQVKLPQSNAARAIISIVIGFLVILSAPIEIISFLSKLSSALVMVVLGILILLVFLEIAGIGKGGTLIKKHEVYFAAALVIIAVLVFVGAGGLQLIGFPQIDISGQANVTIFFFIVIIVAIIWMVMEGKEKQEGPPQQRQ